MTDLRIACVQLTSTTRIADNIALSETLIRDAADRGAQLVGLEHVTIALQPDKPGLGDDPAGFVQHRTGSHFGGAHRTTRSPGFLLPLRCYNVSFSAKD